MVRSPVLETTPSKRLWVGTRQQRPARTLKDVAESVPPARTKTGAVPADLPGVTLIAGRELARLAAMLQLASCRGAIFRWAAPTTLRPDTIVSKISCFIISIWPFHLLHCVKTLPSRRKSNISIIRHETGEGPLWRGRGRRQRNLLAASRLGAPL